jgi:hypothetical protein
MIMASAGRAMGWGARLGVPGIEVGHGAGAGSGWGAGSGQWPGPDVCLLDLPLTVEHGTVAAPSRPGLGAALASGFTDRPDVTVRVSR